MALSASQAFSHAPVPMAVVRVRNGSLDELQLVNGAFADLLRAEPDQLFGKSLVDLFHPDDSHILELSIEQLTDPITQQQVRVVGNQRGEFWALLSVARADVADPDRVVVALQDITAWRRVEEELAHRATHDALTGLANRTLLLDHLDRAVSDLGRRSGSVGVVFCDLDGFKTLNDTFGHRVGDTVLQEVATRIVGAVRHNDVVVRMGGDEFVIVCEAADSSEAGHVAERVRAALEQPIRIHDRDFTISASLGVVQVSEDSARSEDLVRRADLAMYRAKRRGRNRVEFFAPELEDQARGRLEMAERMRIALTTGDVAIEVQPVVRLDTGEWVGSEALARIGQLGTPQLLPAQFLRTAERAGLLPQLDAQVRRLALGWLAGRVSAASVAPHWVSINVSSRTLEGMRFVANLEADLAVHDLAPNRLMIEVAEVAVGSLDRSSLVTLDRLRAMGCLISIDDFGSGRSSLSTLRDVPSDLVKIDPMFVAGLGRDGHDEAIVAAIIGVAHRLGRGVVAEGIEAPEQAEVLRSLGCDFGQGYLFGPPGPPGGRGTA